jgi:O-antigen/teichoic acid export membrane protein
MSFKLTTFKNVFQLGRFTYAGEVLNFLTSMVVARLLMPEVFGFVAMITVFTHFANILSGIGISSEIIRSKYRYTFHKSMMNLALWIGVGLCVLMVLMAYPIAVFYGNMALFLPTAIIAFKFIPNSLNSAYHALILKNREYSYSGKIELQNTVIANVLMIIMAASGMSYWSLIFPYMIGDTYKLIRFINHTGLRFRVYSFKYTRTAFRISRALIMSILGVRIISYWSRNLDNLLIGKLHGEGPLGIYNRGYRFLNLADKIINNLFGMVLYPNLQKLKDEDGDVFHEYLFFVGVISLLIYPIGAVLIVFPDIFVSIVWGQFWLEVAQFLPYFGLVIFTNANKSNIEVLFKLYFREGLLFKFGVFNSTITVIAIVAGSFHSALMIAKLIAFVQVFISLPVAVFFVFGLSMGFSFKVITSFFLPRLLLLAGTFVSLWYGYYWLTVVQMILYPLAMIFAQRNDFGRFIKLAGSKFKSR